MPEIIEKISRFSNQNGGNKPECEVTFEGTNHKTAILLLQTADISNEEGRIQEAQAHVSRRFYREYILLDNT